MDCVGLSARALVLGRSVYRPRQQEKAESQEDVGDVRACSCRQDDRAVERPRSRPATARAMVPGLDAPCPMPRSRPATTFSASRPSTSAGATGWSGHSFLDRASSVESSSYCRAFDLKWRRPDPGWRPPRWQPLSQQEAAPDARPSGPCGTHVLGDHLSRRLRGKRPPNRKTPAVSRRGSLSGR